MHDEAEAVAGTRVDHNSGKRVYLRISRVIRDMIISGGTTRADADAEWATMKRE